MSRRVLTPKPAAQVKARDRMAPGGRLYSESRIRPFSRPVGESGEAVDGYYISTDPNDSGYSSNNPGFSSWWVQKWPAASLGGYQPPVGWYDITITFTLASVYPTETVLPVYVGTFTWPYGDEATWDFINVTGGPFVVGQTVSITFVGFVDPEYDNEADLQRIGTSGDVLWTTDLTQTFMTVVPTTAPVVMNRSRPSGLTVEKTS